MDYMAQPPINRSNRRGSTRKREENDGKKWVAGVIFKSSYKPVENWKIINILFITLSLIRINI